MKALLLSVLCISPLFSLSQDYFPLVAETSLWSVYHYYCKADDNPFSRFVKFQGNVTVNDTVYKQIWICEDTLTEPWTSSGLIREDSLKRVWERSSPQFPEFLKYDFSALPGDTLWLSDNPYPYIMGDQDSLQLLNGTWRKQYHLTFPFWPDCDETWVEGIGCLRGVLESGMCSAVGDNPDLICALNHDTVLYHNSLFSECHLITGIQPSEIQVVRVSPNPASGYATMEFQSSSSQWKLILTDLTGRIFRQVTVSKGTTSLQIDLNNLAPGLYLLSSIPSITQPTPLLVRQ
jgi:hypothetical protein